MAGAPVDNTRKRLQSTGSLTGGPAGTAVRTMLQLERGGSIVLKLLKRLVGIQEPPPPQPRRRSQNRRAEQDYSTEPAALLPEVVEGNAHADWQLWQDSVNSQLTPLTRTTDSQSANLSSQYDELDPYNRVRKKDA